VAGRDVHDQRLDGVADGLAPAGVDLVQRAAHAQPVDFATGGQGADGHRHVVVVAAGVDHVLEQEGLALVLGDAAAELPAHQRVQLGVLVDGLAHANQQPALLEQLQVVVEVGVGTCRGH